MAASDVSKFRSRKWMSMLAVIGLSTILLLGEKITGELWVDVVKWVYGLFAGASVMNKGVEVVRGRQ